jgi:hypothetical protein
MCAFKSKGTGALGTTAALIFGLIAFSAGTSKVAAEVTTGIAVVIAVLVAIFGLKVLSSRSLGGLSFG